MIRMERNKAYNQLKEIIKHIMFKQKYPDFTFVNNVLKCEDILGSSQLWYTFGTLKIVTKENRDNQDKAGQMKELTEFKVLSDGTIILI